MAQFYMNPDMSSDFMENFLWCRLASRLWAQSSKPTRKQGGVCVYIDGSTLATFNAHQRLVQNLAFHLSSTKGSLSIWIQFL